MKTRIFLSFLLTLGFHYILAFNVRLFDYFELLIGTFFVTAFLGFLATLHPNDNKKMIKGIGWGVLLGSISALLIAVGILVLLDHAMK